MKARVPEDNNAKRKNERDYYEQYYVIGIARVIWKPGTIPQEILGTGSPTFHEATGSLRTRALFFFAR